MKLSTISILIALLFSTLPVLAEDSLPKLPAEDIPQTAPVDPEFGRTFAVDCYLGNPSENRNLGSLTVTSVTEAGPACNSTFYECQNGCYGCIENLCMSKSGQKYKR